MQALSFAAHIPLVCFGIAFPAFVVFAEWLHLRTGDDALPRARAPLVEGDARALRGRRRHGHDPELRDGPAVAELHGHVRRRLRARLHDRGHLVLRRGDLHRRSTSTAGTGCRRALTCSPGIPIILSGFTGSLMVIAVNGWMNHPTGFTLENGHAVDVHPFAALFENSYFWHELIHMYIAGYMVAGFLTASVYAWALLRGRDTRYNRTALIIPLDGRRARLARSDRRRRLGRARRRRRRSRSSWRRSKGSQTTQTGRARAPARLVRRPRGRVRDQDPEAALAARLPRPEREGQGARRRARRRPPAGERRALLLPDDGRHRHAASRCSASSSWRPGSGCGGCRPRAGSTARSSPPGRFRSSP